MFDMYLENRMLIDSEWGEEEYGVRRRRKHRDPYYDYDVDEEREEDEYDTV